MIPPPNSDRVPICVVVIAPGEKSVAIGNARGLVYAITLLSSPQVTFSHDYHHGSSISTLLWDVKANRLFSACLSGKVAVTMVRSGMSSYFGKTSTEMLLNEKTSIVEVDKRSKLICVLFLKDVCYSWICQKIIYC